MNKQSFEPKKLKHFDCEAVYKLGSIRNLDQKMIDDLGPWEYQFEIKKEFFTLPLDLKNRPEEHHLPYLAEHLFGGNFRGMRILDLGCNFGHFSFKAIELGAQEVVGVEFREVNLKRAAFTRAVRNVSGVTFYQGRIEDVSLDEFGVFDMVIIAGVFFHLTQPVQILENLFAMVKHGVLIDTNIVPSVKGDPIIQVIHDDPRKENWGLRTINFQPSVTALEMIVKAVGFHEIRELPITNEPYLPQGMWLDHRTAHKIRRQVFYAFKGNYLTDEGRQAFPEPWPGILNRTGCMKSKILELVRKVWM